MENLKKIDIGFDVVNDISIIKKINEKYAKNASELYDNFDNTQHINNKNAKTEPKFIGIGLSRAGHIFVIEKNEMFDRINPTICYDAFYLYKTDKNTIRKLCLVNSDFCVSCPFTPYLVSIESTEFALRQNVASQILKFAEYDLSTHYGANEIKGDFCPFGSHANIKAAYYFYIKNGFNINPKNDNSLSKRISMDDVLDYKTSLKKEGSLIYLPTMDNFEQINNKETCYEK